VILEAIPGYPGRPLGKLDLIQYNQDIREMGLIEKTGVGREIGLIGG
jgi:hypothetical protein